MNQMFIDFLPLLAFYGAYWAKGLYAATVAGIVASTAAIGYTLGRRQPVRPMAWVSFGLILVFGGATLLLHNPIFVKIKPTILHWLFALVLALAPRVAGRNFIRAMLERELRLPDIVWIRLNDSWAAFFGFLGALNLVLAFQFSEEIWVNFHVVATMGLMFVFVVAQGFILQRYLPREDKP